MMVSKAIIWFSVPREVNTAYGMRVVNMSEQIMAHEELIKRYPTNGSELHFTSILFNRLLCYNCKHCRILCDIKRLRV